MEQENNGETQDKSGKLKKNGLWTVIFVVAIIAGVSFVAIMAINAMNPPQTPPTTTQAFVTNPTAVYADSIQNVQLSMQNYNYYPQRIVVKKGIPVRITADLQSVTGCYRGFQIPDLGVRGAFSQSSPSIEFTPTKTGEFRFSCSMGMGTGTIVVQD